MSSDSSEVPQELVDMIIDNLSSDRDTLAQCSLVCKTWVPWSSRYLLRRVYWPPRAYKVTPCSYSNYHSPIFACDCPTYAECSFAMCIDILSSSPRLRSCIREIELTSLRLRSHKVPGNTSAEVIDLLTIATIMDHLPRLEVLSITHGALRSEPSPPTGKGYSIKELHLKDMDDATGVENIPELLSLFRSVQRLSIGRLPGWRIDTTVSCRRSLSALEIESFEFPDCKWRHFIHALCRELMSQTSLASLRRLVCYDVTPNLATLIREASHLESLAIYALNREFSPVRSGFHLPLLTSVTLSWHFNPGLIVKFPAIDLSWIWTHVCEKLVVLAAFDLHEIVLSFWITLGPSEREALRSKGVYTAFETALSRLGDWQRLGDALDTFTSLHALVIELDFNRGELESVSPFKEEPGRCNAIMQDVAIRCLPQKYVDILHVREV